MVSGQIKSDSVNTYGQKKIKVPVYHVGLPNPVARPPDRAVRRVSGGEVHL